MFILFCSLISRFGYYYFFSLSPTTTFSKVRYVPVGIIRSPAACLRTFPNRPNKNKIALIFPGVYKSKTDFFKVQNVYAKNNFTSAIKNIPSRTDSNRVIKIKIYYTFFILRSTLDFTASTYIINKK